jgi:hypothetical protein
MIIAEASVNACKMQPIVLVFERESNGTRLR